jgi:phage-related protein
MSKGEPEQPKPLFWIGSALRDLKEFPAEVRHMVGFALFEAQKGGKHQDAKVLKGFGGAGVLEVVSDHDGDTFRCVYTVKFQGVVYALHAFQKKSKRRIKTPPEELEVVRRRLKLAEEDYAKRRAEEDQRQKRNEH